LLVLLCCQLLEPAADLPQVVAVSDVILSLCHPVRRWYGVVVACWAGLLVVGAAFAVCALCLLIGGMLRLRGLWGLFAWLLARPLGALVFEKLGLLCRAFLT
jgi:hypothetical protein